MKIRRPYLITFILCLCSCVPTDENIAVDWVLVSSTRYHYIGGTLDSTVNDQYVQGGGLFLSTLHTFYKEKNLQVDTGSWSLPSSTKLFLDGTSNDFDCKILEFDPNKKLKIEYTTNGGTYRFEELYNR